MSKLVDVNKMRQCSYLLPDPGGEVVRELLAHIEQLQADKAAVIQQAEIQAQEARTQRGIVMDIGKLVGCDKDWEMVEAVKARIERLESALTLAEKAIGGECDIKDCDMCQAYRAIKATQPNSNLLGGAG